MLESTAMTDEHLKPIRFKKEKLGHGYIPIEGSWESVLVGIRDKLPENVHVVGEGDYFLEQDGKAKLSLKEACFQYYLAGKGHRTLAEIDDLAGVLYDSYPEAYKLQVEK